VWWPLAGVLTRGERGRGARDCRRLVWQDSGACVALAEGAVLIHSTARRVSDQRMSEAANATNGVNI
jgi:hypothetical protein